MIRLEPAQLEHWNAHRWVVLRGALSAEECAALERWTEEIEAWPETPGKWMKYFEPGEARLLCRVENFLPYHEGLRELLSRLDLLACLERLLGEPCRLFKEKINFKPPGGQGFAPHQDAPAFVSFDQRYHVTGMLSVDATTAGNGGLDVVDHFREPVTLPQAEDGTLRSDVVASLDWHPLETGPGDLVLFDSYVPHRSGPNRSDRRRRALYVTWNGASEGDRRADYYERKRRVFPPECERDPNAPLHPEAAVFNLGNPIR